MYSIWKRTFDGDRLIALCHTSEETKKVMTANGLSSADAKTGISESRKWGVKEFYEKRIVVKFE